MRIRFLVCIVGHILYAIALGIFVDSFGVHARRRSVYMCIIVPFAQSGGSSPPWCILSIMFVRSFVSHVVRAL